MYHTYDNSSLIKILNLIEYKDQSRIFASNKQLTLSHDLCNGLQRSSCMRLPNGVSIKEKKTFKWVMVYILYGIL